MPIINERINELRTQPLLGQLTLDTASLDYPIMTAMHPISELDSNELFDRVKVVDQSEKVVTLTETNPFVNVILFTRGYNPL